MLFTVLLTSSDAQYTSGVFHEGPNGEIYGAKYGSLNPAKYSVRYKTYEDLADVATNTIGFQYADKEFTRIGGSYDYCKCKSVTRELCDYGYCSSRVVELQGLQDEGIYQGSTSWNPVQDTSWITTHDGGPGRLRREENEGGVAERLGLFRREEMPEHIREHRESIDEQKVGNPFIPFQMGHVANMGNGMYSIKKYISRKDGEYDAAMCGGTANICRRAFDYKVSMIQIAIDTAWCEMHTYSFMQPGWGWCLQHVSLKSKPHPTLVKYFKDNWEIYAPDTYRHEVFYKVLEGSFTGNLFG